MVREGPGADTCHGVNVRFNGSTRLVMLTGLSQWKTRTELLNKVRRHKGLSYQET